jgi:hypothetical protein
MEACRFLVGVKKSLEVNDGDLSLPATTASAAASGRRYLGGTLVPPVAASIACTLGTGRDSICP